MNRIVRVLATSLVAAACGRGGIGRGEVARDTAARARDCATETTDSARTVCAALQALDRDGMPRREYHLFRHGDTTCVLAGPTSPATVDGEGMAEVVGGRVVNAIVTDSAGCPGEQPQ